MLNCRTRITRCGAALAVLTVITFLPIAKAQERWPEKAAADWYAKQPWLVGSDYIPATAINELEMWQADTFHPRRIDLQSGRARAIRPNTMRAFFPALLLRRTDNRR